MNALIAEDTNAEHALQQQAAVLQGAHPGLALSLTFRAGGQLIASVPEPEEGGITREFIQKSRVWFQQNFPVLDDFCQVCIE